jgi:predicted acyltransferase
MTTPHPPAPAQRLLSLDALRGFDMMFIVGADAFDSAFEHLRAGPPGRWLHVQLDHVAWAGFHIEDLIFPTFVFMVGVALTFSLGRLVASEGRAGAFRRIFRRAALMYLLGLFYYGGFATPLVQIRLMGVLQRIALCYLFASLLFIYLRPRALVATLVGILVGYWALMTFVPVPGFGAGDFAEGHNLANWIDQRFLPLRKWDGDHDPEGLLSTLPAVATCLLGVLAGLLLRDTSRTEGRRALLLAAGGALLIVLGEAWGLQFPVIKKIWTSSFVLVAGGWSLVLLGAFYAVIDIWKVRAWAMPFVWMGTNSIAIYLISNVADFGKLSERFVGGDVATWMDARWAGSSGLALALVSTALCMGLCGFLYRRGIFLRL